MPKADPLRYCHECGAKFQPIVMFPKPLCGFCYSPFVEVVTTAGTSKGLQRSHSRSKLAARGQSKDRQGANDSNVFGSFLKRFVHQPRSPNLSRSPSGTSTSLDTDFEAEVVASENADLNLSGTNPGNHASKAGHKDVDLAEPPISRTMPVSSILGILGQHGCRDVSQDLDLKSFSEYPIATGGFGDIYRARLTNGMLVAVKCTRIIASSIADGEQEHLTCAARELHTWSKLNYRYVLRLIGLAQYRGQIAMVSPWVEHGSLCKYLEGRTQLNRPELCTKIADGLEFLHSNGVIHGDLKGANVLVSSTEEPLIADFGNAVVHERTLQFTQAATRSNLSPRWTAPELLTEAPYSQEADVYALGMTILEIITGTVPYPNLKDLAVIVAVTQQRLPARPEEFIPSRSLDGDTLWSLLLSCWSFEPATRPRAGVVKRNMSEISPHGLVATMGMRTADESTSQDTSRQSGFGAHSRCGVCGVLNGSPTATSCEVCESPC